jgi:dihydroorotate dehydrogenase subfamily 1
MLNCEWGNEKPWTDWRDFNASQVKTTGCPIIISLSGRNLTDCCELIQIFDRLGVDAYEINISCSHSGALHGNLNVDSLYLQQIMKKIRGITTTQIWIKLSYSTQLVTMAKLAEELGANAIVCTNSIGPGLLIDTKTAKPKLGIKGGGGGTTGEAIFPIALWCVSQLSQALTIPIVGSGGISTADKVIQMMMAGASAVQMYTAPALKGPEIFGDITKGLNGFFTENQDYSSIRDLIGLTTAKMQQHQFSSPHPVVLEKRCIGCGICVKACAFEAMSISQQGIAIIGDNCKSCNACSGVCPEKAIQATY